MKRQRQLEAVDGEYTLSAGTHKIIATDKISLRLPESLVSKDRFILRKYKIIRLHDGKVDSLDAENDSNINYYC